MGLKPGTEKKTRDQNWECYDYDAYSKYTDAYRKYILPNKSES